MCFNKIMINESWICFNTTGFNITSTYDIEITLNHVNNSFIDSQQDDLVLDFNADVSSGNVLFEINGFDEH